MNNSTYLFYHLSRFGSKTVAQSVVNSCSTNNRHRVRPPILIVQNPQQIPRRQREPAMVQVERRHRIAKQPTRQQTRRARDQSLHTSNTRQRCLHLQIVEIALAITTTTHPTTIITTIIAHRMWSTMV